jgi:hypothetical protein
MNAHELRQMIRRSDQQPFVVHMDDGASTKTKTQVLPGSRKTSDEERPPQRELADELRYT